MGTPTQLDQDVFRILLYRNDATELLLETPSDGLRIPSVPVPARRRVAEVITAAIKSTWKLETYCLFPLPSDAPSHPPVRCQVLVACRSSARPPAGMQWLPVVSLSSGTFENPEDFAAIQNSITTLDRYQRGELPGAFGKAGWLRTVTRWVEPQAAAAGLRLTGEFRQFNASPTFSLIRFETDGPALWFKAVGEPNLHEYRVAMKLASAFPNFVPQILRSRPDWNAWLTTEAEGGHLNENSEIGAWTTVAAKLAALQLASSGQALHLIHAGCRDVRVSSLAGLLDPFLRVMGELMEQQTKELPARLSRAELQSLGALLQNILASLADSAIPNTLGHLDFNPGNILLSEDRCVFLDWAEACVGHPFITFQYLLESLRRVHPAGESWETRLLSAYTSQWRFFFGAEAVTEALVAGPLLAALAYAISVVTSHDTSQLSRPDTASRLRSLVRRMKREADTFMVRRVPCTS